MLDDQDLINLAQYSGIDLNGWFKNRQDSMIEREKAARDSVIADNQSASAAKLAAMADQVTMAEYEQKLEQMILNGEVTREQANAAIAEARKAAKIANGETPDPAAGDGNNDGTSGNTGDT
jgi:predicted metal-dependent HD superfamily phosphohydrolase